MISKTDKKFFKKAKQVSKVSDFPKIHVGCVAVYHGKVIGMGCNLSKTHPMQKYYNRFRECDGEEFDPKLHAEINCINSIKHMNIPFNKVKLYIYRPRISTPTGMCRPCPSCLSAIRDMNITNVFYTTDYGYAYEKLDDVS